MTVTLAAKFRRDYLLLGYFERDKLLLDQFFVSLTISELMFVRHLVPLLGAIEHGFELLLFFYSLLIGFSDILS